jgi:hypothetical protein
MAGSVCSVRGLPAAVTANYVLSSRGAAQGTLWRERDPACSAGIRAR